MYSYVEFKNRQIERVFLDRFEFFEENNVEIWDKFIAAAWSAGYCVFYYKLKNPSTKNLKYLKVLIWDGYIIHHYGNCELYNGKYKGEDIFRNKPI